jgi:hypothetical protein
VADVRSDPGLHRARPFIRQVGPRRAPDGGRSARSMGRGLRRDARPSHAIGGGSPQPRISWEVPSFA